MTHPAPGTAAAGAAAKSGTISVREKLAYASGDIGSNVIYSPATTFILFYLTNVAGIAAGVAGTVLLLGQLLNGVTDLIVGIFIDKTRTRWGKTRPWILFSALPLGIAFLLLFSVPGSFSPAGKATWAFIMYALVMAVFYTASNVAYSALLSVITPNPKTRVTLTTFRFFAALLTTLIASSITLPVISSLGNDQMAWTTLMGIYAVVAVLTLLVVFFGTKERITAAADEDSSAKQPLGLLLRQLARNKYFWLGAALFTAFYLTSGLGQTVGVYYATSILNDATLFSFLSIAGILPILVGIGFMPAVMGRFGKRNVFLVGLAVMAVGALIPLIAPENFPIVLIGGIVRGLGTVPLTAGLFAIISDVVDYGEWKNGVRTDGLIYSSVVFGQKLGGGLGTALTGWLLAWGGYAANANEQTTAAKQSILAAYFYLPIGLVVIMAVIVWFFRVEKHRPEIDAYLSRHVDPEPDAASSD